MRTSAAELTDGLMEMDGPPPPEGLAEAAHAEAPAVTDTAPDTAPIGRIEDEFPGWGVWRSDTGRWWAFRTAARPLTIEQIRAGCRLIVQADTVDRLRAAILDEIDCTRRDAG
ncbi:hypothetical protein SAMN04489712_109244 [Thermomonospora echinospora]|uniref:Uncharacterized protein n=1 Tax=Thermomonospora echinospora TaxID=1992 RepID=A0A1H6CE32_9ACTN|nr:hypothetical protein [Thermomonospora echinospora]SEG71132.1 hypothetical protein SAMN04489712_109244 [Thermomonospora echinospora]